jgi:RimJ/RimL family protein N-acetyltransferase
MPDDLSDPPSLRGRRVLLRRVEKRDRSDRLAAGRDAEAVRMYGGDDRNLAPFTADDAERWYQAHLNEPYAWVAEFEGRCVGGARLHSLNAADRRARFAIDIFDPAVRNQGLGTEITRLVLRYAFEALALHRVDLRVLTYNHRAIACYEKCGFVREGVERESALVAGEWHSDAIMSILEHEYRAVSGNWEA